MKKLIITPKKTNNTETDLCSNWESAQRALGSVEIQRIAPKNDHLHPKKLTKAKQELRVITETFRCSNLAFLKAKQKSAVYFLLNERIL